MDSQLDRIHNLFSRCDNELKEELEDFYDYLVLKDLRNSTIRHYLTCIRAFLKEYGELNVVNVSNYIDTLNAKKTFLIYLKVFAEFRFKKKKLSVEELMDIKDLKRKNVPKKRTKMIEDTQINEKYKFSVPMEDWNNCYAKLEYYTQKISIWLGFNLGLRSNEIRNLQWKNINFKAFKNGIVNITENEPDEYHKEGFKPKTQNSHRQIPLTPKQKQVLMDYKEKTSNLNLKHDYLVYSTGHVNHLKPISETTFIYWCHSIHVTIKEEGFENKKRLRPHLLRNSFSSLIFQKNGIEGMYALSLILGHSQINNANVNLNINETTQKYLALTDERKLELMLEVMLKAGL